MFNSISRRIAIIFGSLTLLCTMGLGVYLVGHISGTVVLSAAVAAAIGVVAGLQLSRSITSPVKELTDMSRRVAKGEFDQRVYLRSEDELSDLATAFNQMAVSLGQIVDLVTGERDKMAAVLSRMGDAILLIDTESRVTMMNQATERIFQVSQDKTLGHTLIEVLRDHELDEAVHSCLETAKEQTGVIETNLPKRFLQFIVTPLEKPKSCLLFVHDLTELRRLETVRRDFISNVSHELRTPVASIKALAETLQEGAIDDRSVAGDFLDKINTEADRLGQMIQELSYLSSLESGTFPLQKRELDIAQVIEKALDRLRAQANRAGLQLVAQIASPLPRIAADRDRVEQVLINLIHNAIKFTPAAGRITISAATKNNHVVVSVADTGIGIPADDLPRIFERFYKADKARSGGGTGLGLAIAKHIVEAHRGRIWAESIERKGSVFHFTLPLDS